MPPSSLDASVPHCLDALSSSDRHLLTALFDAGGDMVIAAAYVGMEEPELLAWADRPDIRRLVKSERRLRHLKREIKLEAIAMDMLESLQELVHTTEDPVEKRRAASTVLRSIIQTNNPPRPRRPSSPAPRGGGGRVREAGEGDCGAGSARSSKSEIRDSRSSDSSLDDPSPSLRSPAECLARSQAEQPEEESNPLTPASLAKIDANTSAPLPERFYANPRDLLERVADRLALLPNPTGHRAYLAIYGAIQLEIRKNPSTWEPFKEALESSPLCTLAGATDWTRTIDVSDIDESAEVPTASATITWTNPQRATKRSHLRLALEPYLGAGDVRWCITDLKADTS